MNVRLQWKIHKIRGGDHRLQREAGRSACAGEMYGQRRGRERQQGAGTEGNDYRPHPVQPGGARRGRLYQ